MVSDLLPLPYHTKDVEGRCCRSKAGDCLSFGREADISWLEGVLSRVFAPDKGPNAGLIVVAVAVEQGKTFDMAKPGKVMWLAMAFIIVYFTDRGSIRADLQPYYADANHGYGREVE